jgi:DNA-binding PadR family transcriptional regulator
MDPSGQLDLLLMSTLARVGPAHGYALIAALRAASDGEFNLKEGTVYPALHRMEREGKARSWRSVEAGRQRRTYELTARGEEALTSRRREWSTFVQVVNRVHEALPTAGVKATLTA